MASVQELLAAADAEKSPLIKLLEGAATGFASGQNQFYDNAVKLVQAQKAQQEMQIAQAVEQRKAAQRAKAMADEQALKENFRSVSGAPSPVMPVQKLTKVTDEEGNVTTSTTYGDSEDSLNSLLTQKVKSGEMTLDQAYQLKNRSGGGISADLAYRMSKDAKESASGKQLPPNNVLAVNEGQSVARMLPEVEAALQDNKSLFGPLKGRVGASNPYDTTAQTVDARMRTAAQSFGKFMEGGVLRKEDEEKYRKMFPQLSDTPEVAQNKLSIVRRMLAQQYESNRKSLGDSGYDVSGLGELSIPDSIFKDPNTGKTDGGWSSEKESRYQELLRKRGGK